MKSSLLVCLAFLTSGVLTAQERRGPNQLIRPTPDAVFEKYAILSDPEMDMVGGEVAVSDNGRWLVAHGAGKRPHYATGVVDEVIWSWTLDSKVLDRWSKRLNSSSEMTANLIKLFPDSTAAVFNEDSSRPFQQRYYVSKSSNAEPTLVNVPKYLKNVDSDVIISTGPNGKLTVLQYELSLADAAHPIKYAFWEAAPDKLETTPQSAFSSEINALRPDRSMQQGRFLVQIQDSRREAKTDEESGKVIRYETMPSQVVDLALGKAWLLPDAAGIVYSTAIRQDGKHLATIGRNDMKLNIFDVTTGNPVIKTVILADVPGYQYDATRFRPYQLAVRPDSSLVAIGGMDGLVIIDPRIPAIVQSFAGQFLFVSKNWKWLVMQEPRGAMGKNGGLSVWRMKE